MPYEWKPGDSWLGKGGSAKYFDRDDYDDLIKQGATDEQILEKLWGNQKSLRSKDRYKKGRSGGIHRELQFKLQKKGRFGQSMGGDLKIGDLKKWNYGLYGHQDWFSKGDIEGARKSGASEYHIGQLYDRAKALGIKTSNYTDVQRADAPQSDYDYGKLGGWGFDKADAESFGDNWQGIKKVHDWALKNDVYIDHETVNPIMDRLRANQPVDPPDLPGWDPAKPPPPPIDIPSPTPIGPLPSLDDINKDIKEPVPVGSPSPLTDINKGIKEPVPVGSVSPLTDINKDINEDVPIGSVSPLTDINKDIKKRVPIGSVPSLDGINKDIKERVSIGSLPPLTDIIEKIDKPVASTGAGHTYSPVTNKGGYSGGGGAGLKISRTNINTMKRKTWNSSSMNV